MHVPRSLHSHFTCAKKLIIGKNFTNDNAEAWITISYVLRIELEYKTSHMTMKKLEKPFHTCMLHRHAYF